MEWEQNYKIDELFEGNDAYGTLRLYTDGSKLEGNTGYGAVLMAGEDICDEILGSIGKRATVFQA